MKYIHIHVARICRVINEYIGAHGHALSDQYGEEEEEQEPELELELVKN